MIDRHGKDAAGDHDHADSGQGHDLHDFFKLEAAAEDVQRRLAAKERDRGEDEHDKCRDLDAASRRCAAAADEH